MASDWGMEACSSVSTPSANEDKKNNEEDSELNVNESYAYRRSAAMGNYMAQDRPDISFATKEVARGMAKPNKGNLIQLKRLIRYLVHAPRAITHFAWQERPERIDTYSDSDWGGCTKTRRSTSGGAIMFGQHLLHHWSSTQSVVALSSAEAELNALVKGASETIGVMNIMRECGREVQGQLWTDSSAAKAMLHRQGAGRVKHLECRQLWVQEKIALKVIGCEKINRENNIADMLTHSWNAKEGQHHLQRMGVKIKEKCRDYVDL